MNFSISGDIAAQIKAQMEQVKEAVDEGSAQGLDDAAQTTLDAKGAAIERTYQRPERTRKNGRLAWKRSGAWRDSQAIERPDDGTRVITTQGEAANYEGRLANLPTGPDGVNRSNDANATAQRVAESEAHKSVESALDSTLGKL